MNTAQPARAAAKKAPPQKSIVESMADVMRDMRAAGHVVTSESLAVFGDFTAAEVAKHGPEAANLARQQAVRKVA